MWYAYHSKFVEMILNNWDTPHVIIAPMYWKNKQEFLNACFPQQIDLVSILIAGDRGGPRSLIENLRPSRYPQVLWSLAFLTSNWFFLIIDFFCSLLVVSCSFPILLLFILEITKCIIDLSMSNING